VAVAVAPVTAVVVAVVVLEQDFLMFLQEVIL
jgi:hypothetical protein